MRQSQGGSGRGAFTLLELIVAIAVVGLLLAVLLPAIQSVRASSRRATCKNHLHQITIAHLHYHDLYGLFAQYGRLGIASAFRELELLEFTELIKTDRSRIPVLECPTDGSLSLGESPMSYTLNADDSYLGRGPFALHDTATRLQSVTDGTASTIALSERATTFAGGTEADAVQTPIRYHWEIVTNPLPRPSTSSQRGVVTELAVHDCLHGPRKFDPWNEPGVASWRNPNSSLAVHSHLLGPNSVQCWDPVDGSVGGLSYSTVTSLHPGGANVSFLDGQVRLINQNLDLAVWRACGTIAGGESIQMP